MTNLGLNDRRDADQNGSEFDHRTGFWRKLGASPGPARGGGFSSETLRWALGLVLAAAVAYFTTIGTIETRVSVLEERENNHYEELKRMLTDVASDVREIRKHGQ